MSSFRVKVWWHALWRILIVFCKFPHNKARSSSLPVILINIHKKFASEQKFSFFKCPPSGSLKIQTKIKRICSLIFLHEWTFRDAKKQVDFKFYEHSNYENEMSLSTPLDSAPFVVNVLTEPFAVA